MTDGQIIVRLMTIDPVSVFILEVVDEAPPSSLDNADSANQLTYFFYSIYVLILRFSLLHVYGLHLHDE